MSPVYEVVAEKGPEHERIFDVQAIWQGVVLGHGSGSHKQQAEFEAAREALGKKTINPDRSPQQPRSPRKLSGLQQMPERVEIFARRRRPSKMSRDRFSHKLLGLRDRLFQRQARRKTSRNRR